MSKKIIDPIAPSEFLGYLLEAREAATEANVQRGGTPLEDFRKQIETFSLFHLQALLAFCVETISNNSGRFSPLHSSFAHIVLETVLDDMIARTRILAQESDPDAIVGE